MRVAKVGGNNYRLPNVLNDFQEKMYIHLIDWKWEHITRDCGTYSGNLYDVILPDAMIDDLRIIYDPCREGLRKHHKLFPFRLHKHFNHMASSQAANVNLFLPVLLHTRANEILRCLKSDFRELATEHLDRGFRLEYWDGEAGSGERGLLGDHTLQAGTDSDIAIAYHNYESELCLWLIEHKLTEEEFTKCGGFKSRGRQTRHDCDKSFADILGDKSSCYYHDVRKYNYWELTDANQTFFANHSVKEPCPFRGGMNQLWRNQLLAMAVEQDKQQPYKHVSFSVVRHPRNDYLDTTLRAYGDLIGNNARFSVFTSAKVIDAAAKCGDADLDKWVKWYREFYDL